MYKRQILSRSKKSSANDKAASCYVIVGKILGTELINERRQKQPYVRTQLAIAAPAATTTVLSLKNSGYKKMPASAKASKANKQRRTNERARKMSDVTGPYVRTCVRIKRMKLKKPVRNHEC